MDKTIKECNLMTTLQICFLTLAILMFNQDKLKISKILKRSDRGTL